MTRLGDPRRPNLATIVGSGLAVVAAGSLLAFSSLAEQAGLQGLATGGIEPAAPIRAGAPKAIKIPAPAGTSPTEPESILDLIARDNRGPTTEVAAAPPVPPFATAPPAPERPQKPEKQRPDRRRPVASRRARVAVAPVAAPQPDADSYSDGPPYGNANGHHKPKKPKTPKPAKKHPSDKPAVYARQSSSSGDKHEKKWKAPKAQKVEKKNPGKALGHEKHDHANGNGNGNSKAKGKGHKKHGN